MYFLSDINKNDIKNKNKQTPSNIDKEALLELNNNIKNTKDNTKKKKKYNEICEI
jgi:hypothetical protein